MSTTVPEAMRRRARPRRCFLGEQVVRSRRQRRRDRTRAANRVFAGGLPDERGDGAGLGQVDRVAGTSVTVAPVRSAIARCAGGGIIRSSVATRYQLGFIRQEGSLIVPASAFTPRGPGSRP